jgi:phosphoribosylanthranilate isomerase
VDAPTATALARPVRGRLLCVAVTQHPTQIEIDELLAEFAPDALQTDLRDFEALELPHTLLRLPVLRMGAPPAAGLPARLLFEGPVSGAGTPADWDQARALARRSELILAGGLNETNVTAAIRRVRPFGVDVSSGVENAPGVKSPARIATFVEAARAAFRETEACNP